MNSACVPFPAPGGPTRTSLMPLPEEALVVAQHELALDLLGGVEADTDQDQHGRAAERERLVDAGGAARQERQRDDRQQDRKSVVEGKGVDRGGRASRR